MQNKSEFKENWRFDLNAGFILFLLAVPLSVGIAIASGAPPSAGLIAAIIGGVIGSFLGGGSVNINGPAAGLIVTVLTSVQVLGHGNMELGFKYTLAVIIIAGALQILFGALGWARLGLAFPNSVIRGMLTAIGVIILLTQIYVGLGITAHSKNIFGLFLEFGDNLRQISAGAALVCLATLFSLLGAQKLQKSSQFKLLGYLPAPLIGVFTGSIIAHFLQSTNSPLILFGSLNFSLDTSFFLHVPQNISASFITPDFSQIGTGDTWRMVIAFALIASLESTLSAYAVDKLDPLKRSSNLNRDLLSKGFCNMLCGFIGGLPIITEIVRSSANISSGAKSFYANFFHGLFILGFVIFCPWILNEIPLASLAALLVVVGWRLAHPSQFIQAYKIGPDHILSFIVTLITTLAVDLLVGILAGLAVEFAISIFMGAKLENLFKPKIKMNINSQTATIESRSPVIFSNSLGLRIPLLAFLKDSKHMTIDLTHSHFIDHTVMDQLNEIGDGFRKQGLDFKILTSPQHRSLSGHFLASRRI